MIRLITLFSIIQSFFLRTVCLKSFVCDCVACCVKIFQLVRINTWPNRQCVSLDLSIASDTSCYFYWQWVFSASQTGTFYYNDICREPLGQSLSGLVMRWRFWQTGRLTGWICFWEDGADNETAQMATCSEHNPIRERPKQTATFQRKWVCGQTDLQIGSAALSWTSAGGKVNVTKGLLAP